MFDSDFFAELLEIFVDTGGRGDVGSSRENMGGVHADADAIVVGRQSSKNIGQFVEVPADLGTLARRGFEQDSWFAF